MLDFYCVWGNATDDEVSVIVATIAEQCSTPLGKMPSNEFAPFALKLLSKCRNLRNAYRSNGSEKQPDLLLHSEMYVMHLFVLLFFSWCLVL